MSGRIEIPIKTIINLIVKMSLTPWQSMHTIIPHSVHVKCALNNEVLQTSHISRTWGCNLFQITDPWFPSLSLCSAMRSSSTLAKLQNSPPARKRIILAFSTSKSEILKSGKYKIMVGVSHSLLPNPMNDQNSSLSATGSGRFCPWMTQPRICCYLTNTGFVIWRRRPDMLTLCIP